MKFGTLLLILVSAISSIHAETIGFADLDTNHDGKLSETEFSAPNKDVFDQVDDDIDRCLSEKEYKAYFSFEKKLLGERESLPVNIQAYYDLPYVENGHYRHKLDIYLPKTKVSGNTLPLVIWIHGGGWRKGTKGTIARQLYLLEHGFAVASINYRLSHHAKFPAQIYDCKAAIRYLKKHATKYGIDPERFGVWGSSAGGHLVALVGTSGDVVKLEGKLGVTDVSSRVQAVCDWFGPADFIQMDGRPPNPNIKSTDPLLQPVPRLLGGLVSDNKRQARLASPASHVTSDDPPFLIMHGDADPLVPYQQSEILHDLLKKAGVDSQLLIIPGAGHGFFKKPAELNAVTEFFKKQLGR